MKILVIHGPNLNLLGKREVDIYGKLTLEEINQEIQAKAASLSLEVESLQFNHEGEIVDKIGTASEEDFQGIIINLAAYTHTSIAILDAIRACSLPVIDVHLSNILAREEYRKKSITAEGVLGQISGFGKTSYLLALEAIKKVLDKTA